MKSKIALVSCKNYTPDHVYPAMHHALALLGGITNFIRPAAKVLVKPNLLMAIEPEKGVDTHPEIVRAVIRILKEIDCHVFVGDSPSVWDSQSSNLERVWERSGVKQVCQEEKVELVTFAKRRWRDKFPLTSWLDECEYFINLPKFKTHNLTILSAAIKNLFGLVCGSYKLQLHKDYFEREDFSKMLVDIYALAKPHLTIVDAIVAMEGDGPATAGRLRQTNLLLAGDDCVSLDSVLAIIMGLKPADIPYIKEATLRGLGISKIEDIEILGEKLEEVKSKPFLLPTASFSRKIPRPLLEIAKKLVRYYPVIQHNKCLFCLACLNTCPSKAIAIENKKISIDYAKCIACFCCQEVCPAAAIKTKKSILAKIIGL